MIFSVIFGLSEFIVILIIAMILILKTDSICIEVKVIGPCIFSIKIRKDKHDTIVIHRDT